MRIGLFGGTFDPIHIGHLIIMENSINQMNLDKIFILPNSNPPHKINNKKTTTDIRVEMVKESIKDNPKIYISDYEYKDNKVHYSYQTINYFENIYQDDKIFFIMGEDSFMDIESWKRYEDILDKNLIIFKRFSTKDSKLYEKIEFYKNKNKKIYLLDNMSLDISSTLIRNLVKNKKSIKYLVKDNIINIIKERQLYV